MKLRRKWKIKQRKQTIKKNNVVKDTTIKEPIEIKSLKEDKNMNWFERDKF